MLEIKGDLWSFLGTYHAICLTTNGDVRNDGAAVMGRGVAAQAKEYIPGIEYALGDQIKAFGNRVYVTAAEQNQWIVSFPVKYHWHQNADFRLIRESAKQLADIVRQYEPWHPHKLFILPRPGCGNGHLDWADVKPLIEDILPDLVCIITNEEN